MRKKTRLSGISGITYNISNGDAHFIVDSKGEVYAWGSNEDGELGIGSEDDYKNQSEPVKINGLSNIEKIYIQEHSIFAQTNIGEIYSWGDISHGILGVESEQNITNAPIKIEGLTGIKKLYLDYNVAFAINDLGEIYSWGDNSNGQLGIGNEEKQTVPAKVNDIKGIKELYYNYNFHTVFALNRFGEVYSWGANYFNQLGTGDNIDKSVPTKIIGLTNVTKIYNNGSSAYARLSTGDVYAWGYNGYGELGIGDIKNQSIPAKVTGLANVEEIYSENLYNTIFRTKDGELYSCGRNYKYLLGIGIGDEESVINTPVKISGVTGVDEVVRDWEYILVKTQNGEVYSWGKNEYGECGVGNTEIQKVPAKVKNIDNVESIIDGMYLKSSDGKLYALNGDTNKYEVFEPVENMYDGNNHVEKVTFKYENVRKRTIYMSDGSIYRFNMSSPT